MAGQPGPPWELSGLQGDARLLWADPSERRRALEPIVEAALSGGRDLEGAIRRIDEAVCAGLQALGLPRGPIQAIRLEYRPDAPSGQKRVTCDLVLFPTVMQHWIKDRDLPDMVFKTWIHESLHARQPFASQWAEEHRTAPGYEEGMAEGLARLISRRLGKHRLVPFSYEYYVQAYEALAAAANLDVELLWRRLWTRPAGGISAAFGDIVADLYRDREGFELSRQQRIQLLTAGRRVFDRSNQGREPLGPDLMNTWRSVLG